MSDPEPLPDTLVGQKIGNYVLTGLLGRGGMGEVYLAEHPEIGRKVAIKVLAGELITTEHLAARFLAEAKAVARIGHPNVVDIYDFGHLANGRLYYSMELLKGRELGHVREQHGIMSPAEVLPYLEQICAGLQAAHDRGVIHRDLKPENVFVLDAKPLALKILDFGIAKLVEAEQRSGLTSSGMVMGTPLFIAPEQALGQSERISPRTDLYSLGVMLYWMLAGRPPFESEATPVLLTMHIRDVPPPLASVAPQVPAAVAAVVERCLAKAPEQRPASAVELSRAFASAVAASGSERPVPASLTAQNSTSSPTRLSLTTLRASAGESGVPSEEFGAFHRRTVWTKLALVGGVLVVIGVVVFALARGGGRSAGPLPKVEPQVAATAARPPDAAAPRPEKKLPPDGSAAVPAVAPAAVEAGKAAPRASRASSRLSPGAKKKPAPKPTVVAPARSTDSGKTEPVTAEPKKPEPKKPEPKKPEPKKPEPKNIGEGTMEMPD